MLRESQYSHIRIGVNPLPKDRLKRFLPQWLAMSALLMLDSGPYLDGKKLSQLPQLSDRHSRRQLVGVHPESVIGLGYEVGPSGQPVSGAVARGDHVF